MPDYIDSFRLKSSGARYNIHDSRIDNSISAVVPSTRTVATLPLSGDIATATLLAKFFKITNGSSDDWDE